MRKYKDIINEKIYYLTAVKYIGNKQWLFQCDCGNMTKARPASVRSGSTKSCGCHRKNNKPGQTHGLYKNGDSLYNRWGKMRSRCRCINDKAYKDYGGRGIKVCDEWNNFENFYNWAMNNGYKKELTIDRIDPNGNYEPDNCRWIPSNEQNGNRRNTLYVIYNNQKYTMKNLCRKLNLSYHVFRKYYKINKNIDEIIKLINKNRRIK